jgi:hypothetical protein
MVETSIANSLAAKCPLRDDHTELICTVVLWDYPLAAHLSFFVCARKLASKYTSLPIYITAKCWVPWCGYCLDATYA